jgi:hypothetical protein
MLIVVAGSKGGVGTTTVSAGLVVKVPGPVLAMDLTGTGQLGEYLERDMLEAGDLMRRGVTGIQEVLRRQQSVVVVFTEQDRALYPDAATVIARAALASRTVVVDAGRLIPPGLLPLASVLVVVTAPDVRALRSLEQMNLGCVGARVVVLENMVEGESLYPQAWEAIPMARKAGFRSLMRGAMGQALQRLVAELIPSPSPAAVPAVEEPGILRSAVRRLAGG